ncbi:MAG: TonB-dependent receptor [Flavobacteriaceae bacterium]
MKKYLFAVIGCLFLLSNIIAQEDENIGTETVTVVKSYTPAVSDAFKINSVPVVNDSVVQQKKEIEYSIFSVPVASTFSPEKGKATPVQKASPEVLFNSSVRAALGNFSNALLDFHTSRDFDRGDKRFNLALNHLSSRGNIDNTPLNADFYDTDLNGSYLQKERDWEWYTKLGLQHKLYNWYGLPEGIFDEATIAGIDEKQNYFKAQVSGGIILEDGVFKNAELLYRRFWDAVESAENRFVLTSNIEVPLTDAVLDVDVKFDYVGGSFVNASLNNTVNSPMIDYGQLQFGLSPSVEILREDWVLSLGAHLVYGLETQNSDSNFYIYPSVSASYRLSEEYAIAYGGIEGGLNQNSYYDFVGANPYVSPTLSIEPTDEQYNAFFGLRGQLLPFLSYNLRANYSAENRRPLFILNPVNTFRTDEKGYNFGNSFQVFYDDIRTLGFFAELNIDVNRNFSMRINGEFNDYNTETDNPAWNLPEIKGSLYLDYQINDQWSLGANLFYVGEREDFSSVALENTDPVDFPATLLSLDSYFDANLQLGYKMNKQLSLFVRGNNLANNQYERWANFRIQGFQVLAGLTYKFDM